MNEQIILVVILIFSIIIHEVAHGLAALYQGDRTAEMSGRLTLNPIPHIDLVGSIILPILFVITGSQFFLGWAKPVPYNPSNLRNKKWGEAIVASAGPVSNLILMFIFIFLISIFRTFGLGNQFTFDILYLAVFMNLFLALFNLIPIAPLDGSKILFSFLPFTVSQKLRYFMEKYFLAIFVLFLLLILNTNFIFNFSYMIYQNFLKML